MSAPSIDDMTISDIDAMVGVGVEFRLDGKAGLHTPMDVKDVFGGPIKTRKNLIRTELDGDEYRVYIRGYVCVMEHHDEAAVRPYVADAVRRSLAGIDSHIETPSLVGEPDVRVGDRYDVEQTRGSDVLSRLESGL